MAQLNSSSQSLMNSDDSTENSSACSSKYLRKQSVLGRYDFSESTLKRKWQSGIFPSPYLLDGNHRWLIDELDAFDATLEKVSLNREGE